MAWLRRKQAILGAVLSALLLVFCFPKFSAWPLAWEAVVPFYLALSVPQRRPSAVGFWLGFFLFLSAMYWLTELNGSSPADKLFPWIGLALIQGSFFACFAGLTGRFLPHLPATLRPLLFAAAWVLFEWVRSLGKLNFPWFLLASTQASDAALPWLQLVAITGQWGLSFVIALVNGLFGEALRARAWRPAAVAVGVIVVVGLLGMALRPPKGGQPLSVAAIQAGRNNSDDLEGHLRLTDIAARQKPDFVVWTEGATGSLLQAPWRDAAVRELARRTHTTVFVGALEREPGGKKTNSVWCLNPEGVVLGRYDKQVLVPGGEFFPFYEILGGIYSRFGVGPTDFDTPGDKTGVFPLGKTKVGVIICYESVLPWVARQAVQQGAEVLALPTSDASYGTTAGPYQHLGIARVRAVETGRYIVRAAATGVSALIAPDGQVLSRLDLQKEGVVAGGVTARTERTLFSRIGDVFVGLCWAIVLASVLYCHRRTNSKT